MTRSFKPKPSTVHEQFGEETVILNLETGSYYSAQEAGSLIWNLVAEGHSETSILGRVNAEYSGNGDEISAATIKFLDQLAEESLVDQKPAGKDHVNEVNNTRPVSDKTFAAPSLQKFTDMEEMLLLDPIHEVDEFGWPTTRKMPGEPTS
jgi:hypothetical protein